MPFRPGENVGAYRIIEQLGQGGMATVHKAFHPALDRNVAIKALHPAFMEDPQFLARFEREAQVVAKLDHPNIVPIFDFAQHQGQPYLVMKFIEGETLKAVLDRQPLEGEEILRIVESVGAALAYAHARGYLHRDVKPSNILLSDAGNIYLADFGLARIAEAGQSTLSGDQLLGTPHYISPEQARGERELDAGTDIYSLGIVLYQLIVGRVPFSSDTPFSIIHDHIYTPLPLPRQINPQISEALEQVLLKALHKDRSGRYASVNDLVSAFKVAFGQVSQWQPKAAGQVVTPVPSAPPAEAAAAAAPHATAPKAEVSVEGVSLGVPAHRRRWPWVVGGLLLTFACLVTFLIATAGARGAALGDSQAGSAPVALPAEDAIQAARQVVNENPDQPEARVDLARALQGAGFSNAASREMLKAGELYLADEAYPQAAEVLVQAAKLGEGRDPLVLGALSQALFLGAPTGQMQPHLEAAQLLVPERGSLKAYEARSQVFRGETEAARQTIDGVLAQEPANPIANAVLVDVLLAEGRPQEALRLTNELLDRPGTDDGRQTPAWLIEHLEATRSELS